MQEWDKHKFIAEAQQDYRLGAERVAEFDKHIYFAMKRLTAGIAREIVDTSKTAGEAWYRLTDRFYGRNVQGASAIASQLRNLEDEVLAFIRNNTSGAAPMDIGNIAPGQTPTPGLGCSSQSTTSSSHGGSDSYPDLNNYEYAAQWRQDWNTGDVDTSGSSDGELYGLQKGKGKSKSGSFNGICYNCGKSGHSAKLCYGKGGKAKGKGKKGDS